MAIAEWPRSDEVFPTNVCLVGCGGWSADRRYFHTTFQVPYQIPPSPPPHSIKRLLPTKETRGKPDTGWTHQGNTLMVPPTTPRESLYINKADEC